MSHEAQQKTVLSWLKDAHALEVGALQNLEDHISAADGYSEMQSKLRQHLEDTRRHAKLVEGCIERLGGQPATLKETLSTVVGKVTGIANFPAKDTVVKNALGDLAAESFEVASYTSLIAGAEKLDDQVTADTCRKILQDEEDMTDWLKGYIPTLTQQYLGKVEDTQDTSQQTAQDLSDKSKAASGINAKNALLASGALLAGAGAALLVGQALRGRSDKNDQDKTADQTDMQTDLGTAGFGTADLGAIDLGAGGGLTGDMPAGDVSAGDMYDGYVTELEVGSVADAPLTDSLLEPELGVTDLQDDAFLQPQDLQPQDVDVELVYTEAWLMPGLYTGVGPKNSEGTGDAAGQEVFSRLSQHGQVDASLIEITIDNGEVLLEGSVDSEETKRLAEEAVESISGVTKVQNLLEVQGSASGNQAKKGGNGQGAQKQGKKRDAKQQGKQKQNSQEQGAQEFEHSTTIDASPDEVYTFMSQVENLPKYLPTTHSAQPQEGERVRVQGEAQGHEYDADGFFRKDEANHRIEWGADEQYYSGWLEVSGQDEGSTMTVHLSFSGGPPAGEGDAPGESSEAPSREQIQEGLVKSLESIKNFVEEGRTGGKEEPSAAT